MKQEPTECQKGDFPFCTVRGYQDLMPKRHVQNDGKRSLLSDQSVVQPPSSDFIFDKDSNCTIRKM